MTANSSAHFGFLGDTGSYYFDAACEASLACEERQKIATRSRTQKAKMLKAWWPLITLFDCRFEYCMIAIE